MTAVLREHLNLDVKAANIAPNSDHASTTLWLCVQWYNQFPTFDVHV